MRADLIRTTEFLDGKRSLYWALGAISLVVVCVVLPMAPAKVGVAAILGWVGLLWTAISIARGYLPYLLPLWVAAYPYGYYFLSFPAQKSIFTSDRALILLLAIEMMAAGRRRLAGVPLNRDLRVSACFWALYVLLCFLSLSGYPMSDVLPSYRVLVDGIFLPAILGFYAIRYFPLLTNLKNLHIGACILGLGLFCTGLFEFVTGIDLLPWSGSEPMFTTTQLRRADGPFEQQVVLSIVAILAFFFILYLWRLTSEGSSRWRFWLNKFACLASLAAALFPLNRGLVVALVPVAIIDACSRHRLVPRKAWAAFFSLILLAAVAAKEVDPRLYEDRVSNPDNIYQRIAQHQETLNVVRDYPLFGVGFDRYFEVASHNPRYMVRWKGIDSMNVQHNVLMTVLSDQGIVGLLLYVAAQVFFIRAMWKVRKVHPAGWLAYLYCVLVYTLIGVDYATAYFSDINLFYILILASIYQMQTRMAYRRPSPDAADRQLSPWAPRTLRTLEG